MKSTHFKYAIPNFLNAHKQPELSLPSAPPILLSSHFSPHNKCLQWRRKVKKPEPSSAQHVFLSMEDPSALTELTVLSAVVSHTSTGGQGKQYTLKSNWGSFSTRSASVTVIYPTALFIPPVAPLRLNKPFWSVSLHTTPSNMSRLLK